MRELKIGEQVTLLAQVQSVSVKPMRARKGNMLEITIGDGSGATLDLHLLQPGVARAGAAPGPLGAVRRQDHRFPGQAAAQRPGLPAAQRRRDAGRGGRGDRGVRRRDHPGLPGGPGRADLGDRQVRPDRPGHVPAAGRPAAGHDPGQPQPGRHRHRPPRDPPAELAGGAVLREIPSQVGRGVRRTADARATPGPARPRRPAPPGPAPRPGSWRSSTPSLPYELTDGQRAGRRGDRGRSGPAAPDAPPAAGRGRLGQDAGLGARHAPGGRRRRAGGPARPDRGAGHPALPRASAPSSARSAGPASSTAIRPAPSSTLVTGSLGAAARRAALAKVADGTAGIVVGTHALLYEGVDFQDLGLVVVDEQHRFGVEQRDALRAKAARPPHVLVMTATPIPRTVAMTVYGDLETSTLTAAAARPLADRLARRAAGETGVPRPGVAAGARGGPGRPPGVRGLPAHRRGHRDRRRRGAAAGRRRAGPAAAAGGHRGRPAAGRGPAARAADRRAARQAAVRREGRGDARVSPPATWTCWWRPR